MDKALDEFKIFEVKLLAMISNDLIITRIILTFNYHLSTLIHYPYID